MALTKVRNQMIDGAPVNVRDYGAKGDGVTDDTAAIQAAINSGASLNKTVVCPTGTYSISYITLKDGLRGFICTDGAIKGQGTTSTLGVIRVGDGVTALGQHCRVSVRMDMSSGDRAAIVGEANDCYFEDCRIFGFTNDSTYNHYGILLVDGSSRNVIRNNNIVGFSNPTQRGLLIDIQGGGQSAYGGFFSGTHTRATSPALGNIINDNVITYGSYAVTLLGAEQTVIDGNVFKKQNHRSVYLANAAWDNVISNNVCEDYLSTAILLGYGSSYNLVTGNKCTKDVYGGGEAVININTGASNNLIENNQIKAATNYGVYVATDACYNTVQNNTIEWAYVAAIALENDWISPRPTNAIYSRPNYEAPPSPYSAWSYKNLDGNVVKGNVIGRGYTGRNTAAISVAQIDSAGSTSVSATSISDNTVNSPDNISYNIYLYADTDSKFTDTVLINNNFHANNLELSMNALGTTTWGGRISYYADNKELDNLINAEPLSLDGTTTPSISSNSSMPSERLYDCANYTTSTNITNFDDGTNGQVITIRLNTFVTIKYASSLIRPKGLVDVTGNSNNFIQFIKMGVWFETFRNF